MFSFHPVNQRRARGGVPAELEARLPVRQAAVVIAGLSALSWAVLIGTVIGLRAVL
jgi:hypothetical protein